MKLTDLKKELPYRWRVQSINDYNAVCVAYIDSRDVQDLLDEVCGPENWQSDYKEVKGNVYSGLALKIGNDWVWKWDCGTESKTEAEKGEASDSFKRAAVKWGVGRFLYALEIKKLKVTKYKDKNYPLNETTGKPIFSGDELTDYCNQSAKKKVIYNGPDDGERQMLRHLVHTADLTLEEKERAMTAIDLCQDYEVFQKIQYTLEDRQIGYDQVPNPSKKDINKKLKQTVQ